MVAGLNAVLNAGLMVEPTRQEIALPPGGEYEGSYKVTNDFGKTTDISVNSRYWYVAKEEEKNIKISDWLQILPSSFTFEPNETKEVKYKVKISTSITGMRAVMISFVPGGQQGVTLIVSVSLFVTVKGTERVDWDFSMPKIKSSQAGVQFSTIVKNDGNVHVRPSGYIKVIYKKNETILNILEGRPAYPGQTRMIIASGNEKDTFPKPGKYKVIVSLTGAGITKEKVFKVQVKKTGEVTIK